MPVATTYRRRYPAKRKAYTPKRNYIRKPYKRARTSKTVANQVQRVLARNIETKWAAYDYGQYRLVTGAWTVHHISNVAGGGAYNQRIGEYLTPKSIEVRIGLSTHLPPNTVLRCIVFRRKDKAYSPQSDIIGGWNTGTSNTYPVTSPVTGSMSVNFNLAPSFFETYYLDPSRKGDLQVVSDKKYTLGSATAGTFKLIVMRPKVAHTKLHYAPGASEADTGYYIAWGLWNDKSPIGGCLDNAGNPITMINPGPSLVPPTNIPSLRISSNFRYTDA